MPNFDMDIDVDDFLDSCSSYEIEEVKKWLVDSDEISEGELVGNLSLLEEDFVNSLIKIKAKYMQLSIEEIEYLKELSNK